MQFPDPRRSRVVLIGTSEYTDEKLPDLPQVGQSVRDMAAALTDPAGGVVPEVHCEVIADERDLRLIGRKLLAAAEQAEDLDGSYVLTSAQRDQVALIRPGEEHTAFTGRLLTLMREGIPGGPEFLTIDDLYKELLTKMKGAGLSQPQMRRTGTAGMLPLTRNRAFVAIALPALRERAVAAVEEGRNGNWERAAQKLRDILAELGAHPVYLPREEGA
jgi:hypothetical protein